jgi:hypothetical protein
VIEAGAECAVVGFTMLALQFVVAARFSWIEGPFGLDVLVRFHRAMAVLALILFCVHPLLMAAGNGSGLLTRWRVHWYLWAGRSALLVLLLHVCWSLFRRMLPLAYEVWRQWHNVAALAVLGLGFRAPEMFMSPRSVAKPSAFVRRFRPLVQSGSLAMAIDSRLLLGCGGPTPPQGSGTGFIAGKVSRRSTPRQGSTKPMRITGSGKTTD